MHRRLQDLNYHTGGRGRIDGLKGWRTGNARRVLAMPSSDGGEAQGLLLSSPLPMVAATSAKWLPTQRCQAVASAMGVRKPTGHGRMGQLLAHEEVGTARERGTPLAPATATRDHR